MNAKAKEKEMVIVNNLRAAFILPPVNGTEDYDEERGKILIPGENNVTAVCWRAVQNNPAVKLHVRQGSLVNNGAGKATPLTTNWADMPYERVKKIVADLKDLESIKKIKDDANSGKITKLCNARMKDLQDENELASTID